jgi:hypothetical protein
MIITFISDTHQTPSGDGNPSRRTHHFNTSVLDEEYNFTQKPMTVSWDSETNNLGFI